MKWQDAYMIGVPAIDSQHKRIFTLCADYVQASTNGGGEAAFRDFLAVLKHYCAEHFEFEEKCMELYKCPVAGKNKEQHAAFSEAIKNFAIGYEVRGFDEEDSRLLAQTVQEWLANHICKIDIGLRGAVKENENK